LLNLNVTQADFMIRLDFHDPVHRGRHAPAPVEQRSRLNQESQEDADPSEVRPPPRPAFVILVG